MLFAQQILMLCLVSCVLSDENHQQKELSIDPVHQFDTDHSPHDQDKRTLPQPSISYGWAKHIGVAPTGRKSIIGYSPVELKYVPVIKPVHFRPKWPVRPVVLKPTPVVQKPLGYVWVPDHKPALPVNFSKKPWHPQSWAPNGLHVPIKQPSLFTPARPVISRPVAVPIPTKPVTPLYPVPPTPLRPVVPVQPPQLAPPTPLFPSTPYFPNPVFHVTKPNLPVLPLGTQFPSPVLHLHPREPPVVKTHVINVPVHPPSVPIAQPAPSFHGKVPQVFNQRVPLFQNVPAGHNNVNPLLPLSNVAHFNPGLGVQVASFAPQLPKAVPNVAPFNPELGVQISSFAPQLPKNVPNVGLEQHDVQTPHHSHQHPQQLRYHSQLLQSLPYQEPNYPQLHQQQQQQHQLFHPQENYNQHHEGVFHRYAEHYQQLQDQMLQHHQDALQHYIRQKEEHDHHQQQQQLIPHQEHLHQNHQMQQEGLHNYGNHEEHGREQHQQLLQQHENVQGHHVIQPGQTDVQIPYHLPNHPHLQSSGFQPSQNFESFQPSDAHFALAEHFRPSITLNPPYNNRREGNGENGEYEDENEV